MNYTFETKKISIIWNKRPNIIQPFGMFFEAKDAINYIKSISENINDYTLNCNGVKIPCNQFKLNSSEVI